MPRATRKGLPLVPPAPLAFFPSPDELRRALLEWARSDGVAWVFVFKALLTASLALWLAYRLELPQPSTVLVTVFIVMQTQSGQVLAKSFYRIVGTLIGLSVMVTLIALFAQERVLFLACLVTLFMDMYNTYFSDYQSQGRYLMPALVPLMIWIDDGYSSLTAKLPAEWKRASCHLTLLPGTIWLVLFLISYIGFLIPGCCV